jgi:hypothetical protein
MPAWAISRSNFTRIIHPSAQSFTTFFGRRDRFAYVSQNLTHTWGRFVWGNRGSSLTRTGRIPGSWLNETETEKKAAAGNLVKEEDMSKNIELSYGMIE